YRYPAFSVDASHPRFMQDDNRCVLCTRCVRVCDEIEGAHTWDVMGRGIDAKVITDLKQPWGASESCTSCGKCVHVCPTGALFEKGRSVAEMLKRRQFLPYLTLMREDRERARLNWRRSGWTVVQDATCHSSTWTSGFSRFPRRQNWYTARWLIARTFRRALMLCWWKAQSAAGKIYTRFAS